MPICITCSTPVKNLYTTYSKADDRSLGKGVRLTQCPNCKRFADKYVEHDYVVLFIDLVLIKPQVYRHLLFNRLGRPDDKLDPSILRLGTLLVLFDVYITWARIEKSNPNASATEGSSLADAPIISQYLFFLTMNVLATVAQHVVIRLLTRALFARKPQRDGAGYSHSPLPNGDANQGDKSPQIPSASDERGRFTIGPGHASPSAISTALLVSSCTKLFPILLVIWPTEASEDSALGFASRASSYVGWAVLLNNIEALLILLDCGYVAATGLAVAGIMARWLVEGWCLSLVGLRRETGLVVGDFGDVVGKISNVIPYR